MELHQRTKEERLLAASNSQIANLPRLRESLLTGKTNERFFSMTAWYQLETFALKALFIDKDITFARLCFYKCGLLDELLINKYDEKILNAGIVHLTFALLSDDKELIRRYANLTDSTYLQKVMQGLSTPMYILQCIMKDDWAEFEHTMQIMKTKTAPKLKMDLDAAYFEAFAEKDKNKMEQILAELVSPKVHKRRNSQQVYGEFISQPALGYAKLAWLKGIEVEVNSPYVPKELLPVKPLESYRELDLFTDFQ
ncbi:Imm49 family immunity protein [Filimonas effusa]|uniref:Uncharacterized protein n=1 Tax=Filimonas effusa TaxID=2508721 RepID=A0A4Q1DAX4_9BACT|nr:Imm49 family immunity protein [Filimonas effusa]RXK86058.1 hypothetical protein ESB13_04405 [Filimonas effusa]